MSAARTAGTRPVDLMIIGAPKAGTTSLKTHLGRHPGVCTHAQREMQFFASDERYARGFDRMAPVYFPCADRPVRLGKSVAMMYSATALERLRLHNPDVHVVILLRHPVDRAYSEYWYARRRGWERLDSFEAAIEAPPSRFGHADGLRWRCAYIERSTYAPYVADAIDRFGRGRVHIHLLEDLHVDARAVCRSLLARFPELDPDDMPEPVVSRNRAAMPRSAAVLRFTEAAGFETRVRRVARRMLSERTRYRIREVIQRINERPFSPPPLDPRTRAALLERFRPLNARLSELIGRDLSLWDAEPNRVESAADGTAGMRRSV